MKKKRLGEVLRERGHLSAADLGKALQDQQGKSFTWVNCCCNAA